MVTAGLSTGSHQPRTRHRLGWAAVMIGGLALAACSSGGTSAPTTTSTSGGGTTATASASGSGSGLNGLSSVVNRINDSSAKTFSATYQITEAGHTQTVTFAQDPPKSAVITPSGSFYIDGTSIIVCQGSGSSATCNSLPSSLSSELSGITDLFSPTTLSNSLKGLQAQADARAAGVSVTTSSATHGGLESTCFTLTKTSDATKDTYCAANSDSVLTFASTATSSVTLSSFTANPPASTFSPPAGATITTVPGGA